MSADIFNSICITIDIDWACQEVLDDITGILNERNVKATFFCTHPGFNAPGHEKAIHPNFRLDGDSARKLFEERGWDMQGLSNIDIYSYVVRLTCSYSPGAKGVRSHSLIYDSQLLQVYHEHGLQYESNYLMPLTGGLHPVWKEYDILEIPIFFNDHFELKTRATDFQIQGIRMHDRGLKVFQFHPNMVFINAATDKQYLRCKPFYHDPAKLLSIRTPGCGARNFFLELLDKIAASSLPTATLSEINDAWRTFHPFRKAGIQRTLHCHDKI